MFVERNLVGDLDDSNQEFWRPVTQADQQVATFWVSTKGRVWSRSRGEETGFIVEPIRKRGRLAVELGHRGWWESVDRLVLDAFVGSPGPERIPWLEIVHKNGDVDDNSLRNLRWSVNRRSASYLRYGNLAKACVLVDEDERSLSGAPT